MLKKIFSCSLIVSACLQSCNYKEDVQGMKIPVVSSNIPSDKVSQLNYTPIGIVLGKMGRGKTALFNLLCKQNFESSHSGGSVTQHLCKKPVAVGGYKFDLVDTAGLRTQTDVHKHAYLIMTALNELSFNTIFLVLKYHERCDEIFQELSEVIDPVEKYDHKIVFLISHWDEAVKAKNDTKAQPYIANMLAEKGYKNPIIYYSADRTNPSSEFELANIMYKTMTYMKPESCKITLRDFHMNFEISDFARGRMHREYKKLGTSIDDLYRDYLKLVHKYRNEEDCDEIIHFLLVDYNIELLKIQDAVIKKFGDQMNEFEDYTFYIELKAKCIKNAEKFAEESSKYAKWGEAGTALLNIFRKCPHCNLVWSKIPEKQNNGSWLEGCDGSTTCGNTNRSSDKLSQPMAKYRLIRDKEDIPVEVERLDKKIERKKEFINEFSNNNFNKYLNNLSEKPKYKEEAYISYRPQSGKISPFADMNIRKKQGYNNYMEESSPISGLSRASMYLPESAFKPTKEKFIGYNNDGEKKYEREYGCGKSFVWRDAPILNTEELKSLLQFMTPDIVEALISKEQYKKLRMEVLGFNFGTNEDERRKAIWKE